MAEKTKYQSAKERIKAYLDNRAATDEQFAITYAKPNKSINECYNYIVNEAKSRGNAICMTDEEVFGLAVHYYDEDDIKVAKAPAHRAAVSTTSTTLTPKPKLTAAEKAAAKEEAIREYKAAILAEEAKKQREMAKKKPKTTPVVESPSLFAEF